MQILLAFTIIFFMCGCVYLVGCVFMYHGMPCLRHVCYVCFRYNLGMLLGVFSGMFCVCFVCFVYILYLFLCILSGIF